MKDLAYLTSSVPADWEDARPQFTPATLGIPEENVTAQSNIFTMCEGWNANRLKLKKSQKQRLNNLSRERGVLSMCQHDLGGGVSAEELASGDGSYEGNLIYLGPIHRAADPVDGLLDRLRDQS